MSDSSLPPVPPKKSNAGLIMGWLVAALVLAGGAAFLLLGNNGDGNGDQVPTTSAPSGDGKASTPAPPPPPPPPPPPEPPATTAPASTTAPSRPVGQAAAAGDNRGPSGCSGPCTGNADSSLRDALRLRGASARGCYNKALRSNPTLQGKVTVAVRVNPTGGACSANIASDSMGDPSVSSCILQKFRSGAYPKPKGGCVDVQVPLNFVPGGD